MLGRLLSATCRRLRSRFAQARREKLRRTYAPAMDMLEPRRVLAPGDFELYRTGDVPGSPVQNQAPYVQPQIASLQDTMFATGADYASVSPDNGITWSAVNPSSIFGNDPDPTFGRWDNAGLNGTTRLATDPDRGVVVWLAEYAPRFDVDQDGNPLFDTMENGYRLAVSRSDQDLQNGDWTVYDFSMYQLGQTVGVMMRNPQLQVSDNFAYLETDVVKLEEGDNGIEETYQRSVWWRVSLDSLRDGGNIDRAIYTTTTGPIGLVNGAATTMYGATNTAATKMRVYSWSDSDLSPTFVDKTGLTRTVSDSGATSYVAAGKDASGNDIKIPMPNKVQTGWVDLVDGEVGFMWNSQGSATTHPNANIRSVVFDTSSFVRLREPDLYSANDKFFYPAAAVNARGDLAVLVGRYTGSGDVKNDVLIDDSFNGDPANGIWERYTVGVGTPPKAAGSGPAEFVAAGRFYGILADDNFPNTWLASGWVYNGNTPQPKFYWFGRQQDHPEANLMGLQFDVLEDTARPNDPATIRYQLFNEGFSAAGPFNVSFYASVDADISTSDTLISTATIAAGLAAGATSPLLVQNAVMPGPADPFWALVGSGGYYIGMIVDSGDAVSEYDEADNSNRGINIDFTQMFAASFQSNDGQATASDLGYLSGLRTYERLSIRPTGDQDWFKVRAPYDGTLTTTITFPNAAGDLSLIIRNAAGAVIQSSTTSNNFETVTIPVVAGISYYIQVLGVAGAQNEYTLSTDYRIVPADARESNDTLATATNYNSTPVVSEPDLSISQFDDEDYFRFTAIGTGQFTGSIDFVNQYGNLDLYFYHSSGILLAQSTGNGDTESVTAQINAGEIYFIRVNGRGTDTNKYSLNFQAAAPPVYVIGNTVFITGTPQDDTIEFYAQTPTVSQNTIVVNHASFTVSTTPQKYRFDGGAGNDSLLVAGTAGPDTMASTLLSVQLNTYSMDLKSIEKLSLDGKLENDTITSSGNRAVTIYGSGGKDKITGGPLGDTIYGGIGDDTIDGGAGNDNIFGQDGNDVLTDGEGSDKVHGGKGNDTFSFANPASVQTDSVEEFSNEGTDTLSFAAGNTAVTVDLASATTTALHGARTVKMLSSGQQNNLENIVGSSANDTLTGNGGNNVIDGREGNDLLIGRYGNDIYLFSNPLAAQTDRIRELSGQGVDTISFKGSTVAAIVDLALDNGLAQHGARIVNMDAAGQRAFMENIIGGFADDTLYGNGNNNRIDGGEGDDFLAGRTGNDTYAFLNATQPQIDTVQELPGEGSDTLDFSGVTSSVDSVSADLRTSAQTVASHNSRTVQVAASGQAANLENLTGGAGNDVLVGNGASGTLLGNGGRDILIGSPGQDTLRGGAGDDILIGGGTSHSLAQLQTIRDEWERTNNTRAERVSNIRGPQGGLNGLNFLSTSTVFEDNVVDALFGDAGTDWFFMGAGDSSDGNFPPEDLN